MERTERLLDLLALFLDSREPITWAELREAFPEDYAACSNDAAERKFERDKAELLELGIPIQYVQGDDERKDGYVVDRENYYLPAAGLTAEELAVLYAAGSAALASGAFPGRHDLAHALRKVGYFAGLELPASSVRMEVDASAPGPELAQRLEELWTATSSQKWIEISYYSPHGSRLTKRRVDPYGLALRRGVWSLVGYCHLRSDIRTFHVHRIRELTVNRGKPRSPDFEIPPGFQLDQHVAGHPWQHRIHEPIDVTVAVGGPLAPLAFSLFPGSVSDNPQAPDSVGTRPTLVVRTTYLDGLIRHALSLGSNCRITGPPTAVARWNEMLNCIVEAHTAPQPEGTATP